MAAKARVRQTVTKTKSRQKKTGGNSGYHKCPSCNGTGRKRNVGRGAKYS
jgi:hypothetical protein